MYRFLSHGFLRPGTRPTSHSHTCTCVQMCMCTDVHVDTHFEKGILRCAAPQSGRDKPSYLGELPVRSLPLIMLCGVKGKKGCSPLSGSLAKLAWEEVLAPAFNLSVRAWVPVLALASPYCATLGK